MQTACLATIVVPLYQDADSIELCLATLVAQTVRDRLAIIVVDDGSRDGGDVAAERYPVRLIRQRNAGPAAARNRGAAEAVSPILLFLDSDCTVEPNWAEKVLACFADPSVMSVLCPLAAAVEGIVPALVQSEIEERYARLREGARPVDFLAGAAFAIRTEAFSKLGGFNESFRYNEDVELAFRLTDAGNRILFPDLPRVRHRHQTTWRELLRTKFWRGVWRMRLYRQFPHKRVNDAWTPWTLKAQILLVLLVPLTVLIGLFEPAGYIATTVLFAAVPLSDIKLLGDTSAVLRPTAGRIAPLVALGWIFARAATLAGSVVFERLAPWHPREAAAPQNAQAGMPRGDRVDSLG